MQHRFRFLLLTLSSKCIHSLYAYICFVGFTVSAVVSQASRDDDTSKQLNHAPNTNKLDTQSDMYPSRYKFPRSAPPTNNETIEAIIFTLENINSEKNILEQRAKAETLGTTLQHNQSLVISENLKSYVYNIISNITYIGDKNNTNQMIANLKVMFQVGPSLE